MRLLHLIIALPAIVVLLYSGGLYCINIVFIVALPFVTKKLLLMVKEDLFNVKLTQVK